jgi:DNA-binding NtrC family response regulator
MTTETPAYWGNTPAIQEVLRAARMVAVTDAPVTLTGERGTGKEMLAREVHAASRRRHAPFVALPAAEAGAARLETLLLDGDAGTPPGSTLFLDEVTELATAAQATLRRFLELRASGRGGQDLRLIVSSSRDLGAAVADGGLSADLFYRLYIVPLELPPLRRRSDDIILLAKRFTAELARAHGRSTPEYAVGARNLLKAYAWPGNVRELRNLCERMVILLAGRRIQAENLPAEIRHPANSAGAGFRLPEQGVDLEALEADFIRQAVTMTGGNRSKAARLLGITRDTLLYRMRKYALDR